MDQVINNLSTAACLPTPTHMAQVINNLSTSMYTQQIHAAGNQNELFNGSEARVHTQNR
jgi:hypothetical protein